MFKYPFKQPFGLLPLPLPVGFVVLEVALVDVAVGVGEGAILGHAFIESAGKDTAIGVEHPAGAMVPAEVVAFALVEGFGFGWRVAV